MDSSPTPSYEFGRLSATGFLQHSAAGLVTLPGNTVQKGMNDEFTASLDLHPFVAGASRIAAMAVRSDDRSLRSRNCVAVARSIRSRSDDPWSYHFA